jgi:UrcA family protein
MHTVRANIEHEEFPMQTATNTSRTLPLTCAAAVACALLAGAAVASAHNVDVSIRVSAKGLDLSRQADVQTFYMRIEHAAWVACTRGNRVDLVPVDDINGCYQQALGGAIRSVNLATLTQIYLTAHTLRQAAALGIEVPSQLTAR